VGLLSFLQKKEDFFTAEQKQQVATAIAAAEKRTSGEIRVYVESRCRYVDPLDRAAEVFRVLKMHETAQRNAVLVYIAFKDHQLAVLGDEGIHQKTGQQFWNDAVRLMLRDFNSANYGDGIAGVVTAIGQALQTHFPYDGTTDANELPDDIVFGR
jgi:uncharacterized membrane protein